MGYSVLKRLRASAFAGAAALSMGAATAESGSWTTLMAMPETGARAAVQMVPIAAERSSVVAATFTWRAEKVDGAITLSGFAPSVAVRDRLADLAGVGAANTMVVAEGSPAGFEAIAAEVLDLLGNLQSGAAEYDGTRWRIEGAAGSTLAATEVGRRFARSGLAGRGVTLVVAVAAPPTPAIPAVEDYAFTAEKLAAGTVALTGYVPAPQLQRFLAVRAGESVVDQTRLGTGAPANFVGDVLAGLDALLSLEEGKLSLSGGKWTLTGRTETPGGDTEVRGQLEAAGAIESWTLDIDAPPALEPEPAEPVATAAVAPTEPEVTGAVAAPDLAAAAAAEVEPTAPEAAEPGEVTASLDSPAAARTGQPVFTAIRRAGGPVELSGGVPAEPARAYFGVIAGNVPIDKVYVAGNLPPEFLGNAASGLRALTQLSSGELSFDGTRWVLRGTADSEVEREAALGAITSPALWQTDVALTPPLELCERHLASMSAENSIKFQSGKALLTSESEAALAGIAAELANCPDAAINVEGYTDSDGPEDLNLALSVARAEAVVDRLLELGVSPERLYAIGYGESLPVASNDTAAGKQANRRIVFTIAESGN